MTSRDPALEWTPPYLERARAHADEVQRQNLDTGGSERAALVAAIRELAAEVRALRHQLAGGSPPAKEGALGDLADEIHLGSRRGG